jgi:signal transduction histidine kinase
VQALGEQETAGMPALLRLIRNLEAESAMQVDFTVRQGALSVQLEAGAAVALYRAVQEALTNAMRHGAARRVEVRFEAPGGRLFRFEVSNDVAPDAAAFEPGFGLNTMRERVLGAGGQLEARVAAGRFVLRGSFPLEA